MISRFGSSTAGGVTVEALLLTPSNILWQHYVLQRKSLFRPVQAEAYCRQLHHAKNTIRKVLRFLSSMCGRVTISFLRDPRLRTPRQQEKAQTRRTGVVAEKQNFLQTQQIRISIYMETPRKTKIPRSGVPR